MDVCNILLLASVNLFGMMNLAIIHGDEVLNESKLVA